MAGPALTCQGINSTRPLKLCWLRSFRSSVLGGRHGLPGCLDRPTVSEEHHRGWKDPGRPVTGASVSPASRVRGLLLPDVSQASVPAVKAERCIYVEQRRRLAWVSQTEGLTAACAFSCWQVSLTCFLVLEIVLGLSSNLTVLVLYCMKQNLISSVSNIITMNLHVVDVVVSPTKTVALHCITYKMSSALPEQCPTDEESTDSSAALNTRKGRCSHM